MIEAIHRCGFIAIIGRPNVGKSTLLNQLVGRKVSIVSSRPQTTRHRILGVLTRPHAQLIFVDTPGLHDGRGKAINQMINRTARRSTMGVDLILQIVEARGWRKEDEPILKLARQTQLPVVLVINKTDLIRPKSALLPLIKQLSEKYEFSAIVPVSAKSGDNVERLVEAIVPLLPEAPAGFPEDQYSDRGERFFASELIREQLFRGLGQELPYATAVEIVELKKEKDLYRIVALIWVDQDSQKGIVIGKRGEKLRQIGTSARQQMEQHFQSKVFLDLRVKVRSGWANDPGFLYELGYGDDS